MLGFVKNPDANMCVNTHIYVRVTFSASGEGSSYGNIPTNIPNLQNPTIQCTDFALYYGVSNKELKPIPGKGSTSIASKSNTGIYDGKVYGIQLDSWNSSFDTIIKVKKYEENTIAVYWRSYYPGNSGGAITPPITHFTTINNMADKVNGDIYNHRSLFVKEYRGKVLC